MRGGEGDDLPPAVQHSFSQSRIGHIEVVEAILEGLEMTQY